MYALRRHICLRFPWWTLILIFTELWERFSYYSTSMILILYMTNELYLQDDYAYAINSIAISISYYLPILSGYLADKYYGFMVLMFIGGVIISLGHIFMTLSMFGNCLFFCGIGFITVGTGFFRGNIANLLGVSYDKEVDADRVGGFTLFYSAVNLGGFVAAITSGYISYGVSYFLAFGVAGVGMLVALVIFAHNRSLYLDKDIIDDYSFLGRSTWGVNNLLIVSLFVSSMTIPTTLLIYASYLITQINVVMYVSVVVLILLTYLGLCIRDTRERKNYCILMIYFTFLTIFYCFELQLGTLFTLFIDRNVNKYVGYIYIPASISQSINPALIMIVGLITSTLNRQDVYYDPLRIFYAISSNTLCFLVLYLGTLHADIHTAQTSYVYPFVGILIMASGEIMIAPLIQAATTAYAPRGMKGLMMGIYMSMLGLAGLTGIIFARIFYVPQCKDQTIDPHISLEIYNVGFLKVALYNIIPIGLFILVTPLIIYLRKPTKLEIEEATKHDHHDYLRI